MYLKSAFLGTLLLITAEANLLCKKSGYKFPDSCEKLNKNSSKIYFDCAECVSNKKNFDFVWDYCSRYYTGEIDEIANEALAKIVHQMKEFNAQVLNGSKKCQHYFTRSVDDVLKAIVEALVAKNKGRILEEVANNWETVDEKKRDCFCTYRVPYFNLMCNAYSATALTDVQAFSNVFHDIYNKNWNKCINA